MKPWQALGIFASLFSLSHCQIAPSDPEKLARLRAENDVVSTRISTDVTMSTVGSILPIHYAVRVDRADLKSLRLEYSVDRQTYVLIAELPVASRTYYWVIPESTRGMDVSFRIEAVSGSGNFDLVFSLPVHVAD